MAVIHGKSQSTQYLANHLSEINGKRLITLEEIEYFYNNKDDAIFQTEKTIELQQDQQISCLSIEETQLSEQIRDGMSHRTLEVDARIKELSDKSRTAPGIFQRFNHKINHFIQVSLRTSSIEGPFKASKQKLSEVQNKKSSMIEQKPRMIENARRSVINSHNFIIENKSFLIGAKAEEDVISYLIQLPDDYHILNNVKLRFYKAIYWKEYNDYIQSSQIDHIVVGPTGVFLIETKNWKLSELDKKSDELIRQVKRQSLALWYFLKDYYPRGGTPRVWNVVVSEQGNNQKWKLDKYITLIAPYQLNQYILKSQSNLSTDEINRLVAQLLPSVA